MSTGKNTGRRQRHYAGEAVKTMTDAERFVAIVKSLNRLDVPVTIRRTISGKTEVALYRNDDIDVSGIGDTLLTALGDESDRIVGLEIGADDYLPKTFSTRELLARLRAVIRRSQISASQSSAETDEVIVNNLCVNASARRASLNDQTLTLTPVEFDLLFYLARAADRVLSRDQLLDEISGRNYEVFDRSIDVHISSLRRKLGDDPKNPRFIKTVRSAGYMLIRQPEDQA